MACFRVDLKYQRTKTFLVEAASEEDVQSYLESNPDFDPSDIPGLVEEDETVDAEEYELVGVRQVANFRVTEDLELEEIS